ncbi:MAG TPA: hypothetical protein VK566_07170 [Nitrososphaeraceae archaeon]|nr:hypothetical protein [Nitrososphaeraceae archaeon]
MSSAIPSIKQVWSQIQFNLRISTACTILMAKMIPQRYFKAAPLIASAVSRTYQLVGQTCKECQLFGPPPCVELSFGFGDTISSVS